MVVQEYAQLAYSLSQSTADHSVVLDRLLRRCPVGVDSTQLRRSSSMRLSDSEQSSILTCIKYLCETELVDDSERIAKFVPGWILLLGCIAPFDGIGEFSNELLSLSLEAANKWNLKEVYLSVSLLLKHLSCSHEVENLICQLRFGESISHYSSLISQLLCSILLIVSNNSLKFPTMRSKRACLNVIESVISLFFDATFSSLSYFSEDKVSFETRFADLLKSNGDISEFIQNELHISTVDEGKTLLSSFSILCLVTIKHMFSILTTNFALPVLTLDFDHNESHGMPEVVDSDTVFGDKTPIRSKWQQLIVRMSPLISEVSYQYANIAYSIGELAVISKDYLVRLAGVELWASCSPLMPSMALSLNQALLEMLRSQCNKVTTLADSVSIVAPVEFSDSTDPMGDVVLLQGILCAIISEVENNPINLSSMNGSLLSTSSTIIRSTLLSIIGCTSQSSSMPRFSNSSMYSNVSSGLISDSAGAWNIKLGRRLHASTAARLSTLAGDDSKPRPAASLTNSYSVAGSPRKNIQVSGVNGMETPHEAPQAADLNFGRSAEDISSDAFAMAEKARIELLVQERMLAARENAESVLAASLTKLYALELQVFYENSFVPPSVHYRHRIYAHSLVSDPGARASVQVDNSSDLVTLATLSDFVREIAHAGSSIQEDLSTHGTGILDLFELPPNSGSNSSNGHPLFHPPHEAIRLKITEKVRRYTSLILLVSYITCALDAAACTTVVLGCLQRETIRWRGGLLGFAARAVGTPSIPQIQSNVQPHVLSQGKRSFFSRLLGGSGGKPDLGAGKVEKNLKNSPSIAEKEKQLLINTGVSSAARAMLQAGQALHGSLLAVAALASSTRDSLNSVVDFLSDRLTAQAPHLFLPYPDPSQPAAEPLNDAPANSVTTLSPYLAAVLADGLTVGTVGLLRELSAALRLRASTLGLVLALTHAHLSTLPESGTVLSQNNGVKRKEKGKSGVEKSDSIEDVRAAALRRECACARARALDALESVSVARRTLREKLLSLVAAVGRDSVISRSRFISTHSSSIPAVPPGANISSNPRTSDSSSALAGPPLILGLLLPALAESLLPPPSLIPCAAVLPTPAETASIAVPVAPLLRPRGSDIPVSSNPRDFFFYKPLPSAALPVLASASRLSQVDVLAALSGGRIPPGLEGLLEAVPGVAEKAPPVGASASDVRLFRSIWTLLVVSGLEPAISAVPPVPEMCIHDFLPEADESEFDILQLEKIATTSTGPLGMAVLSAVPPLWASALEALASHSPPLVSFSSPPFVDGDLSSSTRPGAASSAAFAGLSSNSAFVNAARQTLLQLLPQHAPALLQLQPAQILFLRASLALECLRARTHSGQFRIPFLYLLDQSVSREGLDFLLVGTALVALRQCVLRLLQLPPGRVQTRALEELAQFLLAQTAHRFVATRALAFQALVELASRFPQLLWSQKLLQALFSLLDSLARRAEVGNGSSASSCHQNKDSNDTTPKTGPGEVPYLEGVFSPSAGAASESGTAVLGGNALLHPEIIAYYRNSDPEIFSLLQTLRNTTASTIAGELYTPTPQEVAASARNDSRGLQVFQLKYPIFPPSSHAETVAVLCDATELALQWAARALLAAPLMMRARLAESLARLARQPAVSLYSSRALTAAYSAGPAAAAPAFLPLGAAARAKTALLQSQGRRAASLPQALQALYSAGQRLRWAGNTDEAVDGAAAAGPSAAAVPSSSLKSSGLVPGANSSLLLVPPATAVAIANASIAASAVPLQLAPVSTAGVPTAAGAPPSHSSATNVPSQQPHKVYPFAAASISSKTAAFAATPWAVVPLPMLLAQAALYASSPYGQPGGPGAPILYSETSTPAHSLPNMQSGPRHRGAGDAASVAGGDTASQSHAHSASFSYLLAQTVPAPIGSPQDSLSVLAQPQGSIHALLPASVPAGSSVSLNTALSALHRLNFSPGELPAPINPLASLGADPAADVSLLLLRRAHYASRVAGALDFAVQQRVRELRLRNGARNVGKVRARVTAQARAEATRSLILSAFVDAFELLSPGRVGFHQGDSKDDLKADFIAVSSLESRLLSLLTTHSKLMESGLGDGLERLMSSLSRVLSGEHSIASSVSLGEAPLVPPSTSSILSDSDTSSEDMESERSVTVPAIGSGASAASQEAIYEGIQEEGDDEDMSGVSSGSEYESDSDGDSPSLSTISDAGDSLPDGESEKGSSGSESSWSDDFSEVGEDNPLSESELVEDLLYRIAALLVVPTVSASVRALQASLAPLLVWLPLRRWRTSEILVATECWEWVLSSNSNSASSTPRANNADLSHASSSSAAICTVLSAEIGLGIQWTIDHGLGMFAGVGAVKDPLLASPKESLPLPSLAAIGSIDPNKPKNQPQLPYPTNVEPHRHLLSFLEMRIRSARLASLPELRTLALTVLSCLKAHRRISLLPECFGPRVRLALLGAELAHMAYPSLLTGEMNAVHSYSGSSLNLSNTMVLADGKQTMANHSNYVSLSQLPTLRSLILSGGRSVGADVTTALEGSRFFGPDALSTASWAMPDASSHARGEIQQWRSLVHPRHLFSQELGGLVGGLSSAICGGFSQLDDAAARAAVAQLRAHSAVLERALANIDTTTNNNNDNNKLDENSSFSATIDVDPLVQHIFNIYVHLPQDASTDETRTISDVLLLKRALDRAAMRLSRDYSVGSSIFARPHTHLYTFPAGLGSTPDSMGAVTHALALSAYGNIVRPQGKLDHDASRRIYSSSSLTAPLKGISVSELWDCSLAVLLDHFLAEPGFIEDATSAEIMRDDFLKLIEFCRNISADLPVLFGETRAAAFLSASQQTPGMLVHNPSATLQNLNPSTPLPLNTLPPPPSPLPSTPTNTRMQTHPSYNSFSGLVESATPAGASAAFVPGQLSLPPPSPAPHAQSALRAHVLHRMHTGLHGGTPLADARRGSYGEISGRFSAVVAETVGSVRARAPSGFAISTPQPQLQGLPTVRGGIRSSFHSGSNLNMQGHLQQQSDRIYGVSVPSTAQSPRRSRRDLLLLLLGHEMDRIAAWHNPLGLEEKQLPGLSAFSLAARLNPSRTPTPGPFPGPTDLLVGAGNLMSWQVLAASAWAYSPLLAVRLWLRLARAEPLSAALRPLASHEPLALRTIPEALPLLVHRSSVESGSPSLLALRDFTPAPLPVLLELLARVSFAGLPEEIPSRPLGAVPVVAAYIASSLRKAEPSSIVFYLPQLVQALRHDFCGKIAEFLFDTAQQSLLVAQQLIWLLVGETDGTEEKQVSSSAGALSVDGGEPLIGGGSSVLLASSGISAIGREKAVDGHEHKHLLSLREGLREDKEREEKREREKEKEKPKEKWNFHGFIGQPLPGPDPLPMRAHLLSRRIIARLEPQARELFELQFNFWEQITNISGRLKVEVSDASLRRQKIKQCLKDLQQDAERDLYYARLRTFEDQKRREKEKSKAERLLQLQQRNKEKEREKEKEKEKRRLAGSPSLSFSPNPFSNVNPSNNNSSTNSTPTLGASPSTSTNPNRLSLTSAAKPRASDAEEAPKTTSLGSTPQMSSLAPEFTSENEKGKTAIPLLAGLALPEPQIQQPPPSVTFSLKSPTEFAAPPAPSTHSDGDDEDLSFGSVPVTQAVAGGVQGGPPRRRALAVAGAVRVLGGDPQAVPTVLTDTNDPSLTNSSTGGAEIGAKEMKLPPSDIIDTIFMPTDPFSRVVSVDINSGRPMQSAAKCPFMLVFDVEPCAGPDAALAAHKRSLRLRRSLQRRLTTSSVGSAGTGFGRHKSLKHTDDTVVRARMGAQHAAQVVRRSVQSKRVVMGKSLEKTKNSISAGLQRLKTISAGNTANSSIAIATTTAMAQSVPSTPQRAAASSSVAEKNESDAPEEVEFLGSADGAISAVGVVSVEAGVAADSLEAYEDAEGVRHASDNEVDADFAPQSLRNILKGSGASLVGEEDVVEVRDGDLPLAETSVDVYSLQSDHDSFTETGDPTLIGREEFVATVTAENERKAKKGNSRAQKIRAALSGRSLGSGLSHTLPSNANGNGNTSTHNRKSSLLSRLRRRASYSSAADLHGTDALAYEQEGGLVEEEQEALKDESRLPTGSRSGQKHSAEGKKSVGGRARTRLVLEKLRRGAGKAPFSSKSKNSAATSQPLFNTLGQLSEPGVDVKKTPLGKNSSSAAAAAVGSSKHGTAFPLYARPRVTREALLAQADKLGVTRLACIFKVFDDVRQDALAIQVIRLLQRGNARTKLGLFLYPYNVVPFKVGPERAPGGVLECVPNVRSRDELGKAGFPTLFDYFLSSFGRPDCAEFEIARRNLIRSQAAYAVVCHLLRIKDRHNGNLLITGAGHVVHIDFGFLLGISPGGNLGFEAAAFKFTQEMLDIMGGESSDSFLYFCELTLRALLIAREHASPLLTLVAGMADSGLPCFFFPDTMQKMAARFYLGATDSAAMRLFHEEIKQAVRSRTTVLYDGIQKLQNNIHSEAWQ